MKTGLDKEQTIFTVYQLEAFGKELNRIRKNCRLTQMMIYEATGINPDTIRKMEKGDVIPKYETLEILSQLYKVDLLNILREFRQDLTLNNLYSDLDKAILAHDLKEMADLNEKIHDTNFSHGSILNPIELNTLKIFTSTTLDYHMRDKTEDKLMSLTIKLITCLESSILNFEFTRFKEYNYTVLEIRLLLTLGILYDGLRKYELSNSIFEFCLEYLMKDRDDSVWRQMVIIKSYLNLAYNFHYLKEHQKVIDYCNTGIEYAKSHHLFYCLPQLIARKGVAEYLLGHKEYHITLKHTINLFSAVGDIRNAELYTSILKNKYNIEM